MIYTASDVILHLQAKDRVVCSQHSQNYNKRLNNTEARWSIYECELYAIANALGKWQRYL